MSKMEVLKDFENKLLDRREVLVKIAGEGTTPSRTVVKAELAKKFKAKENLIIINMISSTFGARDVEVDASIYKTEVVLKRLTPEHIQKRNAIAAPAVEEASE